MSDGIDAERVRRLGALAVQHPEEIAAAVSEAAKVIEAIEAERKRICQLMNGKDDFPGDLVQYVKNQIDGRRAAEADAARLREAIDKAKSGPINQRLEFIGCAHMDHVCIGMEADGTFFITALDAADGGKGTP